MRVKRSKQCEFEYSGPLRAKDAGSLADHDYRLQLTTDGSCYIVHVSQLSVVGNLKINKCFAITWGIV